jgi:hypothetical protein
MGIYIPDVDLPKSCSECQHPTCSLRSSAKSPSHGRHRKCPIRLIENHGNLIDGSKLDEVLIKEHDKYIGGGFGSGIAGGLSLSRVRLKDAEIIIPADLKMETGGQ